MGAKWRTITSISIMFRRIRASMCMSIGAIITPRIIITRIMGIIMSIITMGDIMATIIDIGITDGYR